MRLLQWMVPAALVLAACSSSSDTSLTNDVTRRGLKIPSITLINSDSDSPQALSGIAGESAVITDGSTIDLAKVGRALNVRADVSGVGSVLFDLDNGAISHVENTAPYALASVTGGDYGPWGVSLGSHTLVTTAFVNPGGSGMAGASLVIHFTVVGDASVPTMPPSSPTGPGGFVGSAEPSSYSAPLTITQGGTYSGNWQSTDMSVPALTIQTSEPVIIENCHLSHNGNGIEAAVPNTRVTVRNCYFHGRAPNVDNKARGGGVLMPYFANLVVEHNSFENTATPIQAYFYQGNATAQETLLVRYNKVRNINGTFKDGIGQENQNFVAVQNFVQAQGNPRFGEIAWNDVYNEPFKSSCEDLINFYMAGGRSDSWFKVHDNFMSGAFHPNPHDDNGSAAGIQIDGPDNDRSAYIEVYGNSISQVLNGGMGAAAGSHVYMHGNRVVSSSKEYVTDPVNGSWTTGSYSGLFIFASVPNGAVGAMTDIRIEDNLVGWASSDSSDPYSHRLDISTNLGGGIKNNTHWPDEPITKATEDAEYQLFVQKVAANGLVTGPM